MDRFRSGPLTFSVIDRAPTGTQPTENPETVVLLHGFPQRAASWEDLIPTLTAAGYRVLAPDQRGYASGAQPPGRRSYRLAELVSDVVALLDAANLERVHLVGHDWGGAVAWAFAAAHPERLLTLTSLSTPHPMAMAEASVRGDQLLRSSYMLFFQLPWLPERLLDPSRPHGRKRFIRGLVRTGLDPASAERDADALAEPGALTGGLNWYRALPFSLNAPVGKVTVPTLYVRGKSDRFLGRKAAELTAKYVTGPYAYHELDGDHWIQAEVADPLLSHFASYGRQQPL